MGYDLTIKNPVRTSEYDEARAILDLWDFDHPRWDWAVDVTHTTDYYFRANGAGMRAILVSMAQVGMLITEYPRPEFPKPGDYDSDEAYDQASDETLEWQVPDTVGIPLHKLQSNDPWHVSWQECWSATRIWEANTDAVKQQIPVEWPSTPSMWDRWLRFLTVGADRDGFVTG